MPRETRISQAKLRKEPETPFSLRPKLWTSPVDFGFVLRVTHWPCLPCRKFCILVKPSVPVDGEGGGGGTPARYPFFLSLSAPQHNA